MLKIGIDVRDLRIAKTGARTYLEELISAFRLLESQEVKFFYFDTQIPVYTGRNKFLKLTEHIRFIIWKQIILPLKALSKDCDVVFCTDFFVPYFHLGYQTVPVLHDAFFFEYPQHYNKAWLFLFRHLGISSAKRAFQIITPTLYTKTTISALAGIQPEKITVIHEGPKTLSKGNIRISTATQEIFKTPYLLHVGTMEVRKNMVNLLKAFRLLSEENPELMLVLIGQFSPKTDMDDRLSILSYVAEHRLEEKVIFPGYVSNDLLNAYYRHALLYVFPSINEGFGIPVLEAFDHQLPVLIADNTCLPEVGGDAVVSFNPFDEQDIYRKIKLVLNDPEKRQEMIARGNKRLLEFSWKNTAAELLKIFIESKPEKK